ncbi:flagellar hook-basal body protein FliE [Nocardioides sp. Root122]|uniref:flagellar hook-basal body complex protein FliE n=1 Tax=Nocardioides TaxID=1839 RepID=UPI0007031747|nr:MULTISPECIES: flagellar hook-basal body complex protein FliE [Nocardioides]KQV63231.1 flagellar hook-basal body protein FliE [Nocardioides sp. Root122]MCK9824400.1 flagellar hook-basal body complex protein FliE [Nocardioides cavernae]
MSIGGIEAISGFTPLAAPVVQAPVAPAPASGADFGSLVLDGIERLEGIQDSADTLAVRAASGTLPNIHDYTLAAAEAETATKLTVAVRNKAIEAFTEIMRMQVG